ncbi:MAG: RDD family protein [Deltaproteobacteria bacterium]|nr:RDD family protein [Deltaproteobacteria bacterium]
MRTKKEPWHPISGLRRFQLSTPENVSLRFDLADVGVRLGGVLLDYLFLMLPIFVGAFLVNILSLGGGAALWISIFLLTAFLLRNAYFPWFELRWQGRTPGKRLTGTRVIARDGGPLTPGMVFARNLTRELELFIPIMAIFAPESVAAKVPAWLVPISLLWVLVIVLLPMANQYNSRLGDLLAGTLVVREPRQELLPDLAQGLSNTRPSASPGLEKAGAQQGDAPAPDQQRSRNPTFTAEQLTMYGIRELQVLEDVLRRDLSPETLEVMGQITERIQRKIAWEPASPEGTSMPPVVFLKAFYTAQRAHLEHKMLLGQRQERKRSGRLEKNQEPQDLQEPGPTKVS